MTVFGQPEQQARGKDALAPEPADLKLFARIEGLVGEEAALLTIPARERGQHQHDRLREITAELDRIWEKLRERAERHGHRDAASQSG
jgi:hypothetical protein